MRCSGQLNVISTQMASRCVCIFFEWKQCRHFVWFSAFCKSFHSCSYVQLLVNHYSYQAAATSRRSFEQNVMLFSATGQRVFTCKNRRRYSRERASQSLEENSIHYSFASLVTISDWAGPRTNVATSLRSFSTGVASST